MPVRPLAALALALCLSACGLPAGGPTGASFPEAAAPPGGEPPPFALIEADAAVARALVIREAEAAGGGLEDDGAALGQRIAIGDLVQVSLFEPTGGGLLADQGGTRALPAQAVDDGGAVRIPFAGDVRVAGLSPPEAARAIERRLEGQAIEPQALVVIQDSAKRSVAVLGDAVEGGGQIRLTGGGERLLDVLAAAGGLSKPIHETEVRLTRAGRTTSIDAETLLARPEQNVHVRPRDVIVVEHRPRRFSVLGAASENAQIPFGQSRLSLAEALAKARGLVDTRADPAGVFLARYETAETLAALRVAALGAPEVLPGEATPVVYRLDLSRPEALLTAQRFPVRHGDVLFVSNSTSTPYEKLLRLVGLALAPLNTLLIFDRLAD